MKPRLILLIFGFLTVGAALSFSLVNLWERSPEVILIDPTPSAVEISPTPIPPRPSATVISPSPISLLCLNKVTKELRTSNVVEKCLADENSLGAYRIPIPVGFPNDLNPFFKIRFLAAQSAAKKVGVTLAITSGFRSYSTQAGLFKEALKKYGSVAAASKWVLPPELSHHVLGLALDINYPNDPKSTKWLELNGSKFGICRVYTNEWWHFEGATAPGGRCPKLVADATVALVAD